MLVPAPMQGVLLDAAADLVEGLRAEPDDVEGVEDRDRVGQLVADRVGVAPERIQRCVLDGDGDLEALLLEPVGVDGAGTTFDGLEQPGVQAAPGRRG